MKLRNRLRKLESQTEPEDSINCSCPFHFLLPGIRPGDAEKAAESLCRECGKLKGKPLHFTFKFGGNTQIGEAL